VAPGVNMQGQKELLGLWLSENEGAKPVLSGAEGFWLLVLTELKNRGIKAVFVACVDGLTGFPDAHWRGLPSNAGSALYCPEGAELITTYCLERLETYCGRSQKNLLINHCCRGRTRT